MSLRGYDRRTKDSFRLILLKGQPQKRSLADTSSARSSDTRSGCGGASFCELRKVRASDLPRPVEQDLVSLLSTGLGSNRTRPISPERPFVGAWHALILIPRVPVLGVRAMLFSTQSEASLAHPKGYP